MIRGGLVTLFVKDVGTSVRFYIETLGMKLVEESTHWAVIDAGDGFRIGLQSDGLPATARGSSSTRVGLYPKVPIREAIAIYENRGVRFDVKEDGALTLAHFRDPDENALYLCQGQ
jgi:catechol 2,3-dioxygenase-like lactoylglutathione lyase family enzyme